MKKIQTFQIIFVIILLMMGLILSTQFVEAKSKKFKGPGESLFTTKTCVACHNFEQGDTPVAPDLLGVTQRRSEEWLTKFISNPTQMLKKDKQAKALLKKFNGIQMPNFGLSEEEVADIIEYLKWKDQDLPLKKDK